MKYQEFDSGIVDVNTAVTVIKELDMGGNNFLSFDIANTGSNAFLNFGVYGFESSVLKEQDPGLASELCFLNALSNLTHTALADNNYYRTIKRIVGAANPGTLLGGQSSLVSVQTLQSQLLSFRAQANTTATSARILGVAKGGWEAEFDLFDVTTSSGFAQINCQAYGSAGFEIRNNSGSALTAFGIEMRPSSVSSVVWRRVAGFTPASGGSNDFTAIANSALTNPQVWLTRCSGAGLYPLGGNAPYTIPAGGSAFVDVNILDAAQLRFFAAPTSASVQIRGVLKG